MLVWLSTSYKVEKSVTHTQKGDIVYEVVDIFEHGDIYRIVYPERTDPKDGIGKLASKLSKEDRDRLQNEIGGVSSHVFTSTTVYLLFSTSNCLQGNHM